MLTHSPFLLYCDDEGNIYEDTSLYAVGRSGWYAAEVELKNWIPLPEGGNLYHLPQRKPIGIDVKTGKLRLSNLGWAVAAFIPPAFTGTYIAAYETQHQAPTLPLFCYSAVGWYNNQYFVCALKVENDIRQQSSGFNESLILQGAQNYLQHYPHNRLVKHLIETCCLTYHCPAARNFSLGRWECPIPTSPACNANCVGCISFQPEDEKFEANHERLQFKPEVEEIVEYCVPHLLQAPFPIISFGQGCEGEPLLMVDTIEKAIKEIRQHTAKGSININTNGSNPKAVERLCKAGLNSIRVSLNSTQKDFYEKYYRPNNYQFEDIIESLKICRQYEIWSSINYFIFPGFTDSFAEYDALVSFIEQTKISMIQWRNFNIDPDWYLGKINFSYDEECLGIIKLMHQLKKQFPLLKHGYYNPPLERISGNYEQDFAH
ncbi:MAG: radical SAM protein [Sediminibacterium sp.]|nr:radical SAM protein [Sediminibacterium sp.]